MAKLFPFSLRLNRAGMRVGEECLSCWSPVTQFEGADQRPCAWCQCDWPEDESLMEIVLDAPGDRPG